MNNAGENAEKVSRRDKLPMTITLRNGDDVEFDLGDAMEGLKELGSALYVQVFLREAFQTPKADWDGALTATHEEIHRLIEEMGDNGRCMLLPGIIADAFCRQGDIIANKVNRKLALERKSNASAA